MTLPSTPGTCGIMGLLSAGKAFDTSILGGVTALQGSITSTIGMLSNLPGQVTGILMADVAVLQARISAIATGALNSFVSHLTMQFTSLVSNLTMSVAHQFMSTSLKGSGCNTPTAAANTASDPCSSVASAFGSITGGGSALMGQLTSGLSSLTGAINGAIGGALSGLSAVMGALQGAVAGIEAVGAMVTGLISSEVAQLGAMLGDLLNFTHAGSLFGLLANPCASQVLAKVGTPALAEQLAAPATNARGNGSVVAQAGSPLATILDANPAATVVSGSLTFDPVIGTPSNGATIYVQAASSTGSVVTATSTSASATPVLASASFGSAVTVTAAAVASQASASNGFAGAGITDPGITQV